MFSQRKYPRTLSGSELDDFLAQGWYRMNQMIFTTHFIFNQNGLFSTIWLRYDLDSLEYPKSIRKIKRKNDSLYQTTIGPATINSPRYQKLYNLYRANFSGILPPTLKENILGTDQSTIYRTFAVEISDSEGTLVALSLFDIGASSIASIQGIYHPDYAKDSLGIYSMIREVEWAKRYGKKFFYPGYFVPGWSRFDYKLRLGSPQYYDLYSTDWQPFRHWNYEHTPILTLRRALLKIKQELSSDNIPSRLVFYPSFEEDDHAYEMDGVELYRHPLALVLDKDMISSQRTRLVSYDLTANLYAIEEFETFPPMDYIFSKDYASTFGTDFICLALLIKEKGDANFLDRESLVERIRDITFPQPL